MSTDKETDLTTPNYVIDGNILQQSTAIRESILNKPDIDRKIQETKQCMVVKNLYNQHQTVLNAYQLTIVTEQLSIKSCFSISKLKELVYVNVNIFISYTQVINLVNCVGYKKLPFLSPFAPQRPHHLFPSPLPVSCFAQNVSHFLFMREKCTTSQRNNYTLYTMNVCISVNTQLKDKKRH